MWVPTSLRSPYAISGQKSGDVIRVRGTPIELQSPYDWPTIKNGRMEKTNPAGRKEKYNSLRYFMKKDKLHTVTRDGAALGFGNEAGMLFINADGAKELKAYLDNSNKLFGNPSWTGERYGITARSIVEGVTQKNQRFYSFSEGAVRQYASLHKEVRLAPVHIEIMSDLLTLPHTFGTC